MARCCHWKLFRRDGVPLEQVANLYLGLASHKRPSLALPPTFKGVDSPPCPPPPSPSEFEAFSSFCCAALPPLSTPERRNPQSVYESLSSRTQMPARRLRPCKRRRCLHLSTLNVEIMHLNSPLWGVSKAHFSLAKSAIYRLLPTTTNWQNSDSPRQWLGFVDEIYLMERLAWYLRMKAGSLD